MGFDSHAEILQLETEVVEFSSFFLPESIDDDRLGAARMMIRHSFRSGYALGGSLDPVDVADSVIDQLAIHHNLSSDERGVVLEFPEILELVTQAYDEGAKARNG